MGLFYQLTKGNAPFYSWTDRVPAKIEGWAQKKSSDEAALVQGSGKAKQNLLLQPFHVLGYFMNHGELILMPSLLLFLVLGILGVFVQSSGLAPLIYTLF